MLELMLSLIIGQKWQTTSSQWPDCRNKLGMSGAEWILCDSNFMQVLDLQIFRIERRAIEAHVSNPFSPSFSCSISSNEKCGAKIGINSLFFGKVHRIRHFGVFLWIFSKMSKIILWASL